MALFSKPLNIYLASYNSIQVVGCIFTLLQVQRKGSVLWQRVSLPVKILNLLSFLDALHSIYGLFHSKSREAMAITIFRLFMTWGCIDLIPKGLYPLIVSWALSDLVKHLQYGFATFGVTSPLLNWITYTSFIPLMPVTFVSELYVIWTIYKSQMYIPSTRVEENIKPKDHMIRLEPPHNVAIGFYALSILLGYPWLMRYFWKRRGIHLK